MKPMDTETIAMDENKPKTKKTPGTGRGTGRAVGSKNILSGEVKKDLKAFFTSLTIDNVRWRKNVRRQLESAHNPTELRCWSEIALKYGFGLPNRMPLEGGSNRTLVFAMTHGMEPWDERVDPLREREAVMIKAKEAREKLALVEAAKGGEPVVIDAKADDETEDAEGLESVVPPPEPPEAIGGRGR